MLICVIISTLLFYFVYLRFNDSYSSSWLFHIDSLLQSLIASLLFLILVFILIKPSIKIAPFIAEYPQKNTTNPHLRLKIVNYSLFRAFDILIHIYKVEKISETGSDIRLTLIGKYVGAEGGTPYLQSAIYGLFEETRTNAAQLKFYKILEDRAIREVLDSDGHLLVHLNIKHGLSGLQGNFIKRYHNESCIRKGYYEHGFRTGIKTS